jgi:DNA-binding NarL/FixJ family response regulator
MLNILIADDHPIVRKGIRQLLIEEYPDARIVEVGDAEELLNRIIREDWDAVITDISMPGRSGLDVLRDIRPYYPTLPVLVLSIYPEEQYALRVIRAGASGYLNKDSAFEQLVEAVHRILQGKKYITPLVAKQLIDALDGPAGMPHQSLSDREFEVFRLLAAGLSVGDIAGKLTLSVSTISTYRARILEKMNAKGIIDLVHYAMEYQLLP